MRALRRGLQSGDTFPDDVMELIAYFEPVQPGQKVQAVPGAGTKVPVWMLGSSLFGAQLAAHLGLPYAFASHFAPDMLGQAVEVYRRNFRPGQIEAPRANVDHRGPTIAACRVGNLQRIPKARHV